MTADYIDPDDIERMIVRHETESRILGAYTDLDYSVSIRLHDATAVMLRSLAAENARRQLESTAYDRAVARIQEQDADAERLTQTLRLIREQQKEDFARAEKAEAEVAGLRQRIAALERHGYVVAMRLMQSEVRLDDAEQAGLDAFITKDAARVALKASG